MATVLTAPAATPDAVETADRIRVLLVDDDVDHAMIVRRTLEKQGGFAVKHVVDGPSCLDTVVKEPYGVVLLDYSLPKMNGLEVLAKIRELGADVPVVMATGQGDERIAVQAMNAGAIDYVIKTTGYFATLPTVLNKVLKQHELAADNARLYAESRRQQARLGQILDSTSDGIVLVDRAGVIVSANRRTGELLSVDPARTTGRPLLELLERAGASTEDSALATLEGLFGPSPTIRDGDLELSDGQRIVHWIGQPTDDGELQGFTITIHDVTREREISRMKSDFVSFAAHQLRTPLSGIKWMLEVAREEPGISPTLDSCIADAAASAERLIGMVGDLLDVSRMESGGLTAELKPTDLVAMTRAIVDEVGPLVAQKGHKLTLSGDEGVVIVHVDEQLCRQAMLNLLSNAIKYTPEGGEVSVAITRGDDTLSWAVRDNGIGIPKADQARLFEKFYRAGNAEAVDTNGKGLGLYMVRLIMTRFGGRLHWTSEEGRGTTFGFVLPLGGA
jgi:PAS domain S-box-containing protein